MKPSVTGIIISIFWRLNLFIAYRQPKAGATCFKIEDSTCTL